MSLVTLRDKQRLLAVLGTGSERRDERILSLANQLTWTDAQRRLVELLLRDANQARRRGAAAGGND
jgi:hypothetical protein